VDNLPFSLAEIHFGSDFDKPVDNLPESVYNLQFGTNFDQPVDHLPPKLTQLIFAYDGHFNQRVDNLPRFLVKLEISRAFNQSVSNLPPLKELYMFNAHKFSGNLDLLPPTLTSLMVPFSCKDINLHFFPNLILFMYNPYSERRSYINPLWL